MKITRTYPQPDSPKPHLGARERAMAVYKYLLDLEPEAAIKHPRFAVVVHAFEQSERLGWNGACEAFDCSMSMSENCLSHRRDLDASYCDELSSTTEAELRPLPQAPSFQPDGI